MFSNPPLVSTVYLTAIFETADPPGRPHLAHRLVCQWIDTGQHARSILPRSA
jgi:hypothetical protein